MTITIAELRDILDKQLVIPTRNPIELSRDDAARLAELISEQMILAVWTTGSMSGIVTVLTGTNPDLDPHKAVASSARFAERLWADPVTREAALTAATVVLDETHEPGCDCNAPWCTRGEARA